MKNVAKKLVNGKTNFVILTMAVLVLLTLMFAGCTSTQKTDSTVQNTQNNPSDSQAVKQNQPSKVGTTPANGVTDTQVAVKNPIKGSSSSSSDDEDETSTSEGGSASAGNKPSDDSKGVETSGNYVASLDYKVARDGFKFENYGKDSGYTNLKIEDLQRMFGDGVCASKSGGKCVPTPTAEQWMKQMADSMGGGHCEGMATLSLLFNTGQAKTSEFGGESAYELAIEGNEKLQREIAYWFTTQATEPTSASTIKMSPNEIVEKLEESFKTGKEDGDTYTLGIYKRDMTDGHAITPWAIEDRGDGTVWILIYDNNYPGENKAVVVDKNANTWKYTTSSNPAEAASEYDGDAKTLNLELTPTKVRLQKQKCAFCDSSESTDSSPPAPGASVGTPTTAPLVQKTNELWVDGKGDLLITDPQGRKLGFDSGVLVQTIPGSKYNMMKGSTSKIYTVPTGVELKFSIDGSRLKETASTDIIMFGPGYDLGILNITLTPGRKDTGSFSAKGNGFSYTTYGTETPEIVYDIETSASDYAFSIKAKGLQKGATINTALDTANGKLSVNTKGNTGNVTLFFEMSRLDENGVEQDFGNEEGIVLDPNDTMYFNYAKWTGSKGKLIVELDSGSKGTIDETVELDDNSP